MTVLAGQPTGNNQQHTIHNACVMVMIPKCNFPTDISHQIWTSVLIVEQYLSIISKFRCLVASQIQETARRIRIRKSPIKFFLIRITEVLVGFCIRLMLQHDPYISFSSVGSMNSMYSAAVRIFPKLNPSTWHKDDP